MVATELRKVHGALTVNNDWVIEQEVEPLGNLAEAGDSDLASDVLRLLPGEPQLITRASVRGVGGHVYLDSKSQLIGM